MPYKHLRSLYDLLKKFESNRGIKLKPIIVSNEKLLNQLTRNMMKIHYGGVFNEAIQSSIQEVDKSVKELLDNLGQNDDKIQKMIRAVNNLIGYVEDLYAEAKDIDLAKVKDQLNELKEIMAQLNAQ